MNHQELRQHQAERDRLLRLALADAVAYLDAKEAAEDSLTPSEAAEAMRLHGENACVHLKQAAAEARRARVGEQSTT